MKTHLKKAVLRAVILEVVVVAAFLLTAAFVHPTMRFEEPSDAGTPAATPSAPSKIDRLFESGECWTGEAPADVTMPGHVVLRKTDRDKPAYLGPKWVGRALEQIFEGKDHGIYQINGFCR